MATLGGPAPLAKPEIAEDTGLRLLGIAGMVEAGRGGLPRRGMDGRDA